MARGKGVQGCPNNGLDRPFTSCPTNSEGHPRSKDLKDLGHLTIAEEQSHLLSITAGISQC